MPENITTVLNLPDADFGIGGFFEPGGQPGLHPTGRGFRPRQEGIARPDRHRLLDGRLAMSEILNVIQNASPALAAAIIGLLYAVRGQKKDIEELKKRVDDYDALKLSESLARIQTDLEWIKRKLEEE